MFLPSPGSPSAVLPVPDAAADKAATDNAAADKAAADNAAADKSNPYRQTLAWLSQLCSAVSRAHKPFHRALALVKDTRPARKIETKTKPSYDRV